MHVQRFIAMSRFNRKFDNLSLSERVEWLSSMSPQIANVYINSEANF